MRERRSETAYADAVLLGGDRAITPDTSRIPVGVCLPIGVERGDFVLAAPVLDDLVQSQAQLSSP